MTPARKNPRLTDLELEIMQIVWDAAPDALTVRDVVERMQAQGKEPAYTTVQTMLTILRKKGALASRPGPGRAHEFAPRVTREEATRTLTQDLVQRLFGGSVEPLLTHLVQEQSVDRDTLEALRKSIDERLQDDPPGGNAGARDG